MYVVLDTEVIMGDPMCSGSVWRILAHAKDSWGLKIVVPEVVIIEAVAGYERMIVDIRERIEGTAESKRFRALGLDSVSQVALSELEEQSRDYRERLTQKLLDLGTEIMQPPEVSHLDLVERAAKRRKPCDAKGDGFRDTLNWLTILELLDQYDEDVAWVSNNTKDFGADEAGPDNEGAINLHLDLIKELEIAGHGGRVRYSTDLGNLVMNLARDLAPQLPQDMRGLSDRLHKEMLTIFVAGLITDQLPRAIDPESAALPLYANFASIVSVSKGTEVDFDIAGSAGDESAIATFDFVIRSNIEIGIPEPTESEFESDEQSFGAITKDLRYTGFLILDSLGKPHSGELTAVHALSDDPGRVEWTQLHKRALLLRRLQKQTADYKIWGPSNVDGIVSEFRRSLISNSSIVDNYMGRANKALIDEFRRSLGSNSLGAAFKSLNQAGQSPPESPVRDFKDIDPDPTQDGAETSEG